MGVPSGFVVWREGINDGGVKRLAVRPILQKHGIGTLLLEAVETLIRKSQGRQLFIEVPESLCYLDDQKLASWLKNRGYTGSFVKHGGGVYQGVVEDVIVFGKDITEG
jgi:GNAT superfamily N-acetyltransferase